jgi:hypothetical protein
MNHRQEEGNLLPKQAYLDILDVKSTIEKNWKLFDKQLHDVWWTSGKAGVTFPPGMLPVLTLDVDTLMGAGQVTSNVWISSNLRGSK